MENIPIEKYIRDLSPELQEKARACKSVEELLKLADDNNVELTPDQLEAVSGGTAFTAGSNVFNYHLTYPRNCYNCRIEGYYTGENKPSETPCASDDEYDLKYRCGQCGEEWWVYCQKM